MCIRDRIKKELESVGVETRYMETSYEKDTILSFNIVNLNNVNLTVLNVADEYVKLKKFDFDFQPDLIIVDGHDPYASKATIERFPKAKTIIDADRYTKEIVDVVRKCNYMICSLNFATKSTKIAIDFNNSSTLVTMYDELKKQFDSQIIIVTLGSYGALYSINDQIKIAPALKVNIKDKTGASDIFNGGFAY